MRVVTRRWVVGGAIALVVGWSPPVGAQLGSRPADDWVRVLDAEARVAGLEVDKVVGSLALQPGDVVADLGAGSGPFVPAFAKAVSPGGKVYAVEIDRGFFPYIEARAKDAGVSNVQTVLGEFTDPKLPAADVDVAFFHDVLHHVEDRAAYLASLVRYLKPGARIAVIDYTAADSPHRNEPHLQVTPEQVAGWLAGAGFKPVQEIPIFTDKWFVVYRR